MDPVAWDSVSRENIAHLIPLVAQSVENVMWSQRVRFSVSAKTGCYKFT